MSEPGALPSRPRDRLYAAVTLVLAVLLLPVAFARRPGRARELAGGWALRLRFPAEDLTGLADGARAAFTAARTEALWRHGQLIGLTSGYRHPHLQQRMFDEAVRRSGSPASARMTVLPPAESCHVRGIALDVRPVEGARWLEEHGARYDLYRMYDNEWWHFEHHPGSRGAPPRRPTPAGTAPPMPGSRSGIRRETVTSRVRTDDTRRAGSDGSRGRAPWLHGSAPSPAGRLAREPRSDVIDRRRPGTDADPKDPRNRQ